MKKTRSDDCKLWICVILVFLLLISAWTTLIWIAKKNEPQTVEIIQTP